MRIVARTGRYFLAVTCVCVLAGCSSDSVDADYRTIYEFACAEAVDAGQTLTAAFNSSDVERIGYEFWHASSALEGHLLILEPYALDGQSDAIALLGDLRRLWGAASQYTGVLVSERAQFDDAELRLDERPPAPELWAEAVRQVDNRCAVMPWER